MKIFKPLRERIVGQGDCLEGEITENIHTVNNKLFAHAILNKDGVLVEVSDNFINLTLYPINHLKGFKLKRILSKGACHNLSLSLNILSEQHPFETTELTLIKANGDAVFSEVSFTFFSEGGENRIYTIFKNIDLEKKRVHELYTQKEHFRLLAENTSYVQVLLDNQMNCLFISPSASMLTGYDIENLISENLFRMVHPEDISRVWDSLVRKDIEDKQKIQFRIRHALGNAIPVDCDCRAIRDEFGQVARIVLNLHDITSQKKYEQELIKARKQAEISSSIKNDFLTLITHELRTPLNAIIGFSRVLEQDESNKDCLNYLGVIEENGQQLLSMIDNILDFTQLNTLQYKVICTSIDLDSFFRNLAVDIRRDQQLLNKENVELTASWDLDKYHPAIITDRVLLTKIFKNLLDNAFKFTKEGFIRYGCRPYGVRQYLFFVEDSGIGIPSGKQDVIFEKFSQMDQSNTREYGGLGIGLTVTKQMVEQLGGEIWLKSDDGVGSSFYFTLSVGQLN